MSLDPDTIIQIKLFLATLLSGCSVFLYAWAKSKQSYWAQRGIHMPPGASSEWGHDEYSELRVANKGEVLGNLFLDPSNGDQPVVGVHHKDRPILLLRSPSVIKQVLVKDSELFFNPRRKYLMSKMGAACSGGKPKALFSLMLENAENMRRFLEEKVPANGQKAYVGEDDFSIRYTVDVMSSISFGIRTNSFQTPDPEFYTRCAKGGDVIDSLLDLKNEQEDAPFKFDDVYLADQCIDFFDAGNVCGAVIGYALLELARHPEMQEKVRDEIRENIGDEGVTYESIGKMTYLNQVISETLRLYPPEELLYRVANENYKIPDTDTVIEKGTVICVPLLGLHYDPAFHPDPETFDPERFSEERKKDIKPYTYMPFGDGPKKCIGSRIGLMQTAVALITILRDYEVSLTDEEAHFYFSKSPV